MDNFTLTIWSFGILVALASIVFSWRISRRVRGARKWPAADATIHSAEMDRVGFGRNAADLPCFEFSYAVRGQDYSGRFALKATGERAGELMRQMVQKKMAIRYDPRMPRGWYIPVDTIGGCEVVQNLRPKLDSQEQKV
jgi:hypothetical protein